jgi:hypothetical protein
MHHTEVTQNLFMSWNIHVQLCKGLRNFTSGDDTECISPFNSIQSHWNGVKNSTSRFSHQSHQGLSNTLEEALNTILLCSLNITVTANITPLKHRVLLNNRKFSCYITRNMTYHYKHQLHIVVYCENHTKIPDGVTGIFHWRNPSGRTMGLGLTQPLI